MSHLQLGKFGDNLLEIRLKTLQRHFTCIGLSGSGKTVAFKVLIEELARKGIPVIAFDPKGDIASFYLLSQGRFLVVSLDEIDSVITKDQVFHMKNKIFEGNLVKKKNPS